MKLDVSRECRVSQPSAYWPGMPPRVQVDVIAGRCELEGGTTLAFYGFRAEPAFCKKHKLPGMAGPQRPRLLC